MRLNLRIVSLPMSSGSTALLVASVCVVLNAPAQSLSTPEGGGGLSGEVGIAGEAYTVSGIAGRRDPASILAFGRASYLGTSLRYGFQFLLATEQTGSRQNMNRLSANMEYRFARASIGDMSPVMSSFSIRGTTIRGAAVEFAPGPSLVTFIAGRLRRPVDEPASNLLGPSFREMVYAARVGAGPSNGSHLHVIGMVARDAPGSLSDSLDIPPRENVSFTPDLGLVLLDRRLEIGGTYTLAAFSADTRTPESDADVSSMLGFFTPRVGSRMDYAADVYARLSLRDVRLRMSYERIQPGFRSLGLWQTRSDQATFRFEPSLLMADRKVNVGLRLASSRNNLEGNRAATLRRRSVYLYGNFRLSPVTNLAAAYSNLRSLNELEDAAASTLAVDQKNVVQSFMISPTFTVANGATIHVLSTSATYQFLRDKSPEAEATTAAKFDNFNVTTGYNVAFGGGMSLNASVGYLSSSTSLTSAGAFSVMIGAGRSFAGRRANIGLTGGWSRNSLEVQPVDAGVEAFNASSKQWSSRLSGSYRLPTGSVIRLSVRGLRSSGDLTPSFRELRTTLRFEHRF